MLPEMEQLHRAVAAYVRLAYEDDPPQHIRPLMPPPAGDVSAWLMGERIERDPPDAPLEQVRSFVLRLGNRRYPHMKIRLTRPAERRPYVLSVDAHDVFLHALAHSPDAARLEDLKRFNARLAQDVMARWDAECLPTERQYMRRLIEQARTRQAEAQK
jgi:hypothetical protein